MHHDQGGTRRRFTQAARDAALARRRELAAMPKDPAGQPRLFITRGARAGNDFGWEIRRFGALVVVRSDRGYASADLARDAGRLAIEAFAKGLSSRDSEAREQRESDRDPDDIVGHDSAMQTIQAFEQRP